MLVSFIVILECTYKSAIEIKNYLLYNGLMFIKEIDGVKW